jgi:hypothetical protein
MTMTVYRKIPAAEVPPGLAWDIPPASQGHIVEVAYAHGFPSASPSDEGDAWKRVTDRSDGWVGYWQAIRLSDAERDALASCQAAPEGTWQRLGSGAARVLLLLGLLRDLGDFRYAVTDFGREVLDDLQASARDGA